MQLNCSSSIKLIFILMAFVHQFHAVFMVKNNPIEIFQQKIMVINNGLVNGVLMINECVLNGLSMQ